MTKINKNFTLDSEIVEKLKQLDNASALVERLLKEHFQFNDEKKKNLIQQTAYQLKNYSIVAKKLKKEMKLLKELDDLQLDKFTLRWLMQFSTAPTNMERIDYSRQRGITLNHEKIIKAWEVIQKDVGLFEKI